MTHAQTPPPVFGTLALAMSATVVSVLPVFLTGALAVELTGDLAFGEAGLGMAIATYRFGAATTSRWLGGVTDRMGANMALRLAILLSGAVSVVIGVAVRSFVPLLACLFVAGTAQALSQPASNRMLIDAIRPGRRGIAFGFKQAAPPTASMLAGVSVPLVGATVGWRVAYLLVPVLMLPVFVGLLRRRTAATAVSRARAQVATQDPGDFPDRHAVLALALAFGLGNAASGSVAAFYVDSSVTLAGLSGALAGTMLAVGSVAAVLVRLIAGSVCDRMYSRHLLLAAGLLSSGAVGIVLIGTGSPRATVVGIIIALGGTWGFNGVYWFALMTRYPQAPGRVTGAVAPGGLIGAVTGPIVFGATAGSLGYPWAWGLAAVLSVLAGAAMVFADRAL